MTTNHAGPCGEMHGSESTEVGSSPPWEIPRRMRQTVSAYPQISSAPYVLIISSDEALADTLVSILDESGFAAEHAMTMTDGCALAESGHFHVVLTEPSLNDGSWRRLASLTRSKHLELVIVLIAKSFDLFCIMTCVTPCIRTSVTLRIPCFRPWQGLQGARRATGQPCQLRAASPAAAYFLLTD